MIEQNAGERLGIGEESVERAGGQRGEGFVGRGEDGEVRVLGANGVERIVEISLEGEEKTKSDPMDWYRFFRDWRMEWWKSIGLGGENLILLLAFLAECRG